MVLAHEKLQWGRALVSAEGAFGKSEAESPEYASMGPRSGERGRCQPLSSLVTSRLASMGPRSGERGRTPATTHPDTHHERFNGAALW